MAAADAQALQQELQELREENAALLEALRLAQLGGVDLQGHLLKFNPDASAQGIFSLDWELRYFVLQGTLLKYYTSERDVGYAPRGVVELEDCHIEVDEPERGRWGWTVLDPDNEPLLRLGADKLATAKTWLRTLAAMGLTVRGFRRLDTGGSSGASLAAAAARQQLSGEQPPSALRRSLASLGRALSVSGSGGSGGRWLGGGAAPVAANSIDSGLSVFRLPMGHKSAGASDAGADASADAGAGAGAGAHAAGAAGGVVDDLDDDVLPAVDSGGGWRGGISLQRRFTAPVVSYSQSSLASGGGPADADTIWEGDHDGRDSSGGGSAVAQAAAANGSNASAAAAAEPGGGGSAAPSALRRFGSYSGGGRWGRAFAGEHGSAAQGGGVRQRSLAQLRRLASMARRSSSGIGIGRSASSSRRWEKLDLGDELPACEHSGDSESLASTTDELDAAAAAAVAAVDADAAAAAAAAAASQPSAGPQQDAAGAAATAAPPPQQQQRASAPGGAQPSGSSFGQRTRQGSKGVMDGASPVHVAGKDSLLTVHDAGFSVARHEGLLNLGIVVLVATNLRLLLSNLYTYGLRLGLPDRASLAAAFTSPPSRDDALTLAATPACALFAVAALLIELLGLRLLLSEEQALRGWQKKEVPAADAVRRGAAAGRRSEWLLFLLNLVNASSSIVAPCALVLCTKSSLVPASILTVTGIVTSMKLATYAHCNTTLRMRARERALAAVAAGLPVPDTRALPRSARASGGSGRSSLRLGPRLSQTNAAAPGAGEAGAGDGAAPAGAASTPFAAAPQGRHGHSHSHGHGHHASLGRLSFQGLLRLSQHGHRASGGGGVPPLQLAPPGDVAWPWNLGPWDLAYFMVAPTLTYQLNFPRLARRRWRLLARWVVLFVATTLLMSFVQVQFLLPCMQSSLMPLRQMNLLRFTERLLRLAVPNTLYWLAMFYAVFHLWLNILGELLLFADRMFYKEWWNASTLADYWKLWNVPVHKWMLRTCFFPLVRRGAPKYPALLFVFFVSAVMHELAVGVPLRMLRGWAFWGMMLQVPLISLTELLRRKLKADSLGNMVFWASFCVLGQPMCLVLYYHDWLLAAGGESSLAQAVAQGEGVASTIAAGAAAAAAGVLGGVAPLGGGAPAAAAAAAAAAAR